MMGAVDVAAEGLAGRMTPMRDVLAALHDVAAVRVLQPLHRAYRRWRPATREALLAFNDGMRFRRETARWAAEQKREWILRRLRLTARRAAREAPYYRELFARVGFDPDTDFDFADFARLPVLERA